MRLRPLPVAPRPAAAARDDGDLHHLVTFFSANLGACSTLASCSEAQQRVSAIELAPTEWREKSPAVGLHRSWTPLQSDLEQGTAVQAREEKLLELQLEA